MLVQLATGITLSDVTSSLPAVSSVSFEPTNLRPLLEGRLAQDRQSTD